MPICPKCNKKHRFAKYDGVCKLCHQIDLSRERHDKICEKCGAGFMVDGLHKWHTKCSQCTFQSGVCLI